MERQISARSETFHPIMLFLWTQLIYSGSGSIRAEIQPSLNLPVLWIRIRIRMFLGLPNPHPDPLVTSTDLAPDPSIIKQK